MSNQIAEVSPKYLVGEASNRVPAGYKQTEVGVIPEDWEVCRLGDVMSLINGCAFKPSDWKPYGTPIIRIQNLNDLEAQFNFYDGNIDDRYLIQRGDLLFAWSGTLGTSFGARVWQGPPGILNQHIFKVIPKNQVITPQFTLLALRQAQQQIEREAHGFKTSFVHIKKSDLSSVKLKVPLNILEQTAIANALSDVDALISELEKLIAKKQAIKTATMQQLLTGRTRLPQFALREDGTPKGTKPSELGEIPEDWEAVRLGHLAKFFKGSGLPKSELSESGKVKCIHYGQLFTTYGPKIERVMSRTKSGGVVTSQENDVLMPTSDVTPNGLATASCISETGVILGSDILIIRTDKQKLNGIFFSYLVSVLRDQVMQLVTGSTVYHLYGCDMAKFMFALPSSEEQTAIATILSDMDEEIQALEQRLGKTRQIKQGMMQELLTGKTRLMNA
ncbi:MAG: restriction endonuclease subunit S [Neptunomonas phycophila]|uniref:restriction endonuclease subunit S n=1 Tax=Neptunomonas phycophila TaxID=1572645 RepID=UPI003B8AA733